MNDKIIAGQLLAFAKERNLDIGQEQVSQLLAISHTKTINKGALIASIGDATSVAGLVLSGIVRSYYIDNEGNDITRGFMPAGFMCMDEGFFGYNQRIWMNEALEDTTILFFETKDIKALIKEFVPFKDLWITLLEHAIPYKIFRENGFLTENAKERYMHFKELYPDISDRVPQKHLATFLGIAPESLSRIKNTIKE